jgi:hypothetical protein
MNNSARRINALSQQLGGHRYLEIGVLGGHTFIDVDMDDRTAVDPGFQFDTDAYANERTRFWRETSDAFFAHDPIMPPYDVVLIDGMHTFEQVFRDLTNVLLRTQDRSVIVLDDTVPDDAYSTVKNSSASYRYREMDGVPKYGWQGDVFKSVFLIHDFFPSLNYRTIVGMGNPQTIVWRGNPEPRRPVFDNMEAISRLSYFDLKEHWNILYPCSDDEALSLCIEQLRAR